MKVWIIVEMKTKIIIQEEVTMSIEEETTKMKGVTDLEDLGEKIHHMIGIVMTTMVELRAMMITKSADV